MESDQYAPSTKNDITSTTIISILESTTSKSNPPRTTTTSSSTTRKNTRKLAKKNIDRTKKKKNLCPSNQSAGKYPLKPIDLNSTEQKLILFWDPPSDWNGNFDKCECNNCKMTFDKCDFPKSHAVLFHLPTLSVKAIPAKIPGQVWILLNYEPPERSRVNLNKWRNMFNWTWSYRRDSDFSFPYFDVVPIKNAPQNRNFSGILEKKSKMAAWFVSHCNTESKREKYIQEMQKYVDIDVYGKCGPLKCPYDGAKCYDMINTVYNFYMGFENSLCTDYVTEKAFAYMSLNTVLVLRGGYLKDFFLPPNSYIDTNKFSSVQKLTSYLQSVSKNNTEYEKYLNWKNYYEITRDGSRGLCSMCKRLQETPKYIRVYGDIQKWATTKEGQYICDRNPKDIITR